MWWREDITEELAILGAAAKDIVISVSSGLVGYMSGRTK